MKKLFVATITVAFLGSIFISLKALSFAEESTALRYVFNITPKKMQGISMTDQSTLHELHIEVITVLDKDCSACHLDNDETFFMGCSTNDSSMTKKEKTKFIHKSCNSCHLELHRGPTAKDCESCHNVAYAPVGEKIQTSNCSQESHGRNGKRHHGHSHKNN